jgi:hypothetical protein
MATDKPNPERRTDSAVLCLSIGVAMIVLAWVLGVGGIITTAMSGGSLIAATGGLAALIVLPLTGAAGAVLCLIGVIWLFVRVIADQREDNAKQRYGRDVER